MSPFVDVLQSQLLKLFTHLLKQMLIVLHLVMHLIVLLVYPRELKFLAKLHRLEISYSLAMWTMPGIPLLIV